MMKIILFIILLVVDHVEICKKMRLYSDVRAEYQTFIDIFDSLRSEGIYPTEASNDAIASGVMGTCDRIKDEL